MRGKVGHALASSSILGITPAYAGKRPADQRACIRHRDHPRVCGEKQSGNAFLTSELEKRDPLIRKPLTSVTGSPPRMRGKVVHGRY